MAPSLFLSVSLTVLTIHHPFIYFSLSQREILCDDDDDAIAKQIKICVTSRVCATLRDIEPLSLSILFLPDLPIKL